MSFSIQIREATNADGDGVGDIIRAAFSEYGGCFYDRALEFPELDALADHFRHAGGRCWVASDGDSIIGSCAIAPSPRPLGPFATAMEIKKVYLDRRWRGAGLADRLLVRAVEFAGMKGVDGVELWTDTRFLAAHRFYARKGFTFSGWTRAIDDISATLEYHYHRRL